MDVLRRCWRTPRAVPHTMYRRARQHAMHGMMHVRLVVCLSSANPGNCWGVALYVYLTGGTFKVIALSSRISQYWQYLQKAGFRMPCSEMGPFLAIAAAKSGRQRPGRGREVRYRRQAEPMPPLHHGGGGFKASRCGPPERAGFVDLPCISSPPSFSLLRGGSRAGWRAQLLP